MFSQPEPCTKMRRVSVVSLLATGRALWSFSKGAMPPSWRCVPLVVKKSLPPAPLGGLETPDARSTTIGGGSHEDDRYLPIQLCSLVNTAGTKPFRCAHQRYVRSLQLCPRACFWCHSLSHHRHLGTGGYRRPCTPNPSPRTLPISSADRFLHLVPLVSIRLTPAEGHPGGPGAPA